MTVNIALLCSKAGSRVRVIQFNRPFPGMII
jgi:hypothetical protein